MYLVYSRGGVSARRGGDVDEQVGELGDLDVGLTQAQGQVEVFVDPGIRADRVADALPRRPAHGHVGTVQIVDSALTAEEPLAHALLDIPALELPIRRVVGVAESTDGSDARGVCTREEVEDRVGPSGTDPRVGIDPAEKISCRPVEPGISSECDTWAGLEDPADDRRPLGNRIDDLARPVRRVVVHHRDFVDIRLLLQQGRKTLTDVLFLVVRRHDHRQRVLMHASDATATVRVPRNAEGRNRGGTPRHGSRTLRSDGGARRRPADRAGRRWSPSRGTHR